jgi:hypothetical protein
LQKPQSAVNIRAECPIWFDIRFCVRRPPPGRPFC